VSHEPVAPPKLVAARRRWNTFALTVLLLAASAPVALLAGAYWSPRPVRAGPATLLGPKCQNEKVIIMRLPQPGATGFMVFDYYTAGGARAPYMSVTAHGPPSQGFVYQAGPDGRPLPAVTGKHLWRLGPFTLVWH